MAGFGARQLVATVASADLARSARFYRDQLGFPLVDSNDVSDLYDAAGTPLRVTRVGSPAPPPYTVVGWDVADVRASVAALRAAGVRPVRYDWLEQDADDVWTAPGGTRVAWFTDPDGNVLSVQQPPAG
jgi:catechol 2,3-dioxygenase-like lactoylglutathione lyase family enzyme